MKLYHFSNLRLNKLIPKIAENCNCKDQVVVNKPVIWLSNLPKIQNAQITQYRYTVDVPDNDPDLGYDKSQQIAAQIFQLISDSEVPIWYYLARDIDVLETEEWVGTEYVRVTNFED